MKIAIFDNGDIKEVSNAVAYALDQVGIQTLEVEEDRPYARMAGRGRELNIVVQEKIPVMQRCYDCFPELTALGYTWETNCEWDSHRLKEYIYMYGGHNIVMVPMAFDRYGREVINMMSFYVLKGKKRMPRPTCSQHERYLKDLGFVFNTNSGIIHTYTKGGRNKIFSITHGSDNYRGIDRVYIPYATDRDNAAYGTLGNECNECACFKREPHKVPRTVITTITVTNVVVPV